MDDLHKRIDREIETGKRVEKELEDVTTIGGNPSSDQPANMGTENEPGTETAVQSQEVAEGSRRKSRDRKSPGSGSSTGGMNTTDTSTTAGSTSTSQNVGGGSTSGRGSEPSSTMDQAASADRPSNQGQ